MRRSALRQRRDRTAATEAITAPISDQYGLRPCLRTGALSSDGAGYCNEQSSDGAKRDRKNQGAKQPFAENHKRAGENRQPGRYSENIGESRDDDSHHISNWFRPRIVPLSALPPKQVEEAAGALEPSSNRPRFSGALRFAGKGEDANRRSLPLDCRDSSRRCGHGLHAVACGQLLLSRHDPPASWALGV
jgi:hypothetical protein